MKRTFLKLEGLRGSSNAPGHIGDLELWPIYTFSRQPVRRAGPAQLLDAEPNYLVVYKNGDESTMALRLAYSKDQVFRTGELVIEEISDRGHLLRTTAFKMRSIVIDKLDILGHKETISLKFESMSVAR